MYYHLEENCNTAIMQHSIKMEVHIQVQCHN